MKKILILLIIVYSNFLFAQIDASLITVSNHEVELGNNFDVTISTSELLSEWNVTAYQFELSFDSEIIDFVGYELDDTISEGGTLSVNAQNDVITVGFMTIESLTGSGTLLRLEFSAIATGFSELNPTDFIYNVTSITDLNEGSVIVTGNNSYLEDSEITISNHEVESGNNFDVTISTSELLSEWNVTAYQFELNFDSEIIDFVGYELDDTISEGGTLSVNDQNDIITLGLMTTEPLTGSGTLLKLEFSAISTGFSELNSTDFLYNTTPITDLNEGLVTVTGNGPFLEDSEITVSNHEVEPGNNFDVTISTSELLSEWNVTAYQFELNFDSEIIDFVGYELDDTISEGGTLSVNDQNDIITVGLMTTEPLTGSGTLLNLEFSAISTGFSELNPTDFLYNTTPITDLNEGLVTVTGNGPFLEDSEITVSNHEVEFGESFELTISTTELLSAWNVTAYQFELNFDNEIIDFVGYELEDTISEGGSVSINDQDNSLTVGCMTTYPLEEEGILIRLNFAAVDIGLTDIEITDFLYNTTEIVYLYGGSIEVTGNIIAPDNLIYEIENENDVILSWDAPEYRNLIGYKMFRDNVEIAEIADLSYLDEDLPNGEYEYFVKAVYTSGDSDPSNTVMVSIEVDDNNIDIIDVRSSKFNSIFPNPFNPETTISYQIHDDDYVTLEIYDIKGCKIKTLVSKQQKSGQYIITWDGTSFDFQKVSSGIYFIRLKTSKMQSVKKIVLMK